MKLGYRHLIIMLQIERKGLEGEDGAGKKSPCLAKPETFRFALDNLQYQILLLLPFFFASFFFVNSHSKVDKLHFKTNLPA